MKQSMEEALLKVFELERCAAEKQAKKGTFDAGRRSEVTGGRHLDPVVAAMVEDIGGFEASGISVHLGSDAELPGWFRQSKNWDVLVMDKDSLVAAVELKSIGSSYGNNFNNRTEEALGSATDALSAIRYGLCGEDRPSPLLGYILIVRSDERSRRKGKVSEGRHFPIDPIFRDRSYLERFQIMCMRMLKERLYDAVWLVFVDTEKGSVLEPCKALSYKTFMERLGMQIELFDDGTTELQ